MSSCLALDGNTVFVTGSILSVCGSAAAPESMLKMQTTPPHRPKPDLPHQTCFVTSSQGEGGGGKGSHMLINVYEALL